MLLLNRILLHVIYVFMTDERPISMQVSREEWLKTRRHSNSNPSLNAVSDLLSPTRALNTNSEDWKLGQISKEPGNRSSMAESKAGHMKLPMAPANKKVRVVKLLKH